MKFSTKDRDNDEGSGNCANIAGAWWYKSCAYVHPNRQYKHRDSIYLNSKWHPLLFIEIKIKPHKC